VIPVTDREHPENQLMLHLQLTEREDLGKGISECRYQLIKTPLKTGTEAAIITTRGENTEGDNIKFEPVLSRSTGI